MCWAVLRAPAGKRLAPMLPVLVPMLRRDGELDAHRRRGGAADADERGDDRPPARRERAKLMPRGRSHTKPGSLLKSQIPIRTWAEWDDAVPGFVEIDLVGHEGGNASGEFCFTLTVTDIATGWTVNRSVRNKAAKWVFEALEHVTGVVPVPDHRHRFGQRVASSSTTTCCAYCTEHQITFTRSRPGQQERRRPRGAEELGPGPGAGRLPPLRHRRPSWRSSTRSGNWTGSSPTTCCPSRS